MHCDHILVQSICPKQPRVREQTHSGNDSDTLAGFSLFQQISLLGYHKE